MTSLPGALLDFVAAGGVTMVPLLLCCTAMWYLILRAGLDLLPRAGEETRHELAARFSLLRSRLGKPDARLAGALAETLHARTRRRLSLAAAFAGAAPLLGLLGTVTGMIDTFDGVARFGMLNPKAVSSGISQAMISTQTGLVVAVPGMLAVYFLRRRALRTRSALARFGGELAGPAGERA